MAKKVLLMLVFIMVGFVVVVARQPNEFRVARSIVIAAPAEAVFAQVNDFHKWQAWSPWAKIDPQAKNTYEGSESGVGAVFKWAGNSEVGEGMMTLVESQPHAHIKIKLDFIKPFKASDITEFTFVAQEGQTTVTWNMFGTFNFLSKAFGLFMDYEKIVGGQFEEGLAQIKTIVEAAP